MNARCTAAVATVAGFAASAIAQCPPATPGGLSASDGTQCNGVFVNWNDVSGATSYQVWRSFNNNLGQAILIGSPFESEWMDLTAVPGVTHYYWVRAFRAACVGNNFGPYAGPNIGYRGTTPGTPSGLVASDGTCGSVELSWNTVAGPPLYQVYRNTVNDWASSTLAGVTFGGSLSDVTALPMQTYYYWVRSSAACGDSGPSNMDTGVRGAIPIPPSSVTAAEACGGIRVTWSAGYAIPQITGYNVLRGTSDVISLAETIHTTSSSATTYVDQSATPGITYYYWVSAMNACSSLGVGTPGAWGTTAYTPLAISQQPQNLSVAQGASASFSAAASGVGFVTYQWHRNGGAMVNGGSISGATGSTLTINPVAASDAGGYWVVVSDSCGSLTSTPATLTVSAGTCYANCDGSTGAPLLTANDFQCFLNKFAAGDSYANCDGSTGVPALTANDFQCYLNKFAAGCS
jgi:hypothetical protein